MLQKKGYAPKQFLLKNGVPWKRDTWPPKLLRRRRLCSMWSVSLWRLGFIVSRKFQRVRFSSTMSDSVVSFWFPGVIVSKVFQRAKSVPRCATQGCPWRRAPRTRDWIVDLTQVTVTLPQLPARGDTQSQSRWGYKILIIWRIRVQEYFAKTEKRFKEVVFTNRVTPQVLTPPLTAVWVQTTSTKVV